MIGESAQIIGIGQWPCISHVDLGFVNELAVSTELE
jgi:hypothetical protein